MTKSMSPSPIVIAHRGASGYLPEHTLAAYFLAIEFGADYIEPDLVMTRDGELVARHENALALVNEDGTVIEATTDVMAHPEFADRKATKQIDGVALTGWFTEDFTLAELRTLRARERLPALRPANTRFDDKLSVPTLNEILALVDAANRRRQQLAVQLGRPLPKPLGIYPETKHPTYFAGLGLAMETSLVETLHAHGYQQRTDPVFIQSFEVSNLQALRSITDLPLIQLIDAAGSPFDVIARGMPLTYADMVTPQGLVQVATYAQGIGVHKDLIIPRNKTSCLTQPTPLTTDAHQAGLLVHAWTFRAENAFLPADYASSQEAEAAGEYGDLHSEIARFVRAGIDGFFTDQADIGVAVRESRQVSGTP